MSDKEILEELEAAYGQEDPSDSIEMAGHFEAELEGGEHKYFYALGYLAAKRKYQQTAQTGEVKTRQTFEEWIKSKGYDDGRSNAAREQGWNAALASVISTGKRFEVGDEVEIDVGIAVGDGAWVKARIQAVSMDARNYTYQPQYVRQLPTTVNLTVEEKLVAVTDAMVSKENYQERHVYRELCRALASGKSLDDLCREYSVPLTKESRDA